MSNRKSQLDMATAFAVAEFGRVGNVEKLPVPVRSVLLVVSAQGVIDNGGLQYFFESDFPNNPPYEHFVEAYRTIGADAEAAALADAVSLFPFAEPHKHQRRRDRFLGQYQDRADSPFEPFTRRLCGNRRVWQLLDAYVAVHAAVFA